MMILRQHTQTVVTIGPLVDWRDGKSLVSSAQPADLQCEIYKNGVGASKSLAGALTVQNGAALLTLTAQDTDTIGRLDVCLRNAVVNDWPTDVIVPRMVSFLVVAPAYYDQIAAPQPPSRVSMV